MGFRTPGSEGAPGRPRELLDRGTSSLIAHRSPNAAEAIKTIVKKAAVASAPGGFAIVGAYHLVQWYYRKNIEALAAAADRALALAPGAIAEETGLDDLGKLLDFLLQGLLATLIVLAASTALGSAIGAVIGAFFGGVGAAPGAIAGAQVGLDLGVVILTWLGVGFLATSIVQGFGELTSLVTSGIRRGWEAGDEGSSKTASIEAAARDLSRGLGVLVRLILEGILVFLFRKAPMSSLRTATGRMALLRAQGAEVVAAETVAELVVALRRSRFGDSFAAWIEANWRRLVENPKLQPGERSTGGVAAPSRSSDAKTPSQAKSAEEAPPTEAKKATPEERLAQRRREEMRRRHREEMEKADRKGAFDDLSAADKNWIKDDPTGRRKQLAFDAETGSYKVGEAQAALRAESQGLIKPPIERPDPAMRGTDFIDAAGKEFDVKRAAGLDRAGLESKVLAPARAGEHIIVDATGMSSADVSTLRGLVKALPPGSGDVIIPQ